MRNSGNLSLDRRNPRYGSPFQGRGSGIRDSPIRFRGGEALGRLTDGSLVTFHPRSYKLRQNSFIYAAAQWWQPAGHVANSSRRGRACREIRGFLFSLVATRNYLLDGNFIYEPVRPIRIRPAWLSRASNYRFSLEDCSFCRLSFPRSCSIARKKGKVARDSSFR